METKLQYIIDQLRDIRDSDQVISVNGDGCHVLQTLQGDPNGECDLSPSELAERLQSQPSVYDQIDHLIDTVAEIQLPKKVATKWLQL